MKPTKRLSFNIERTKASFIDPSGALVEHVIEIRENPLTSRTCRIAYGRSREKEAGTETFPDPPPFAADTASCPFCSPQLTQMTPKLLPEKFMSERMISGESVLFPNLFPYGKYSAVSIFDQNHFVEIGNASAASYANSFRNSIEYIKRILKQDPKAIYVAITQNHLPSAGGSLVHPHLQINADRLPGNHHRFLKQRCRQYYKNHQTLLLSDYLDCEMREQKRFIGTTGDWHWLAAFAPEGFYEIWGIIPGVASIRRLSNRQIVDFCQGIIQTQKFYRSLNRNGYNLGLLSIEREESRLELRAVLMVRSNYAPWVRNDHTGFEVMLGDMATFTAPEQTAALARPFWNRKNNKVSSNRSDS